jgi:hypothetical protein
LSKKFKLCPPIQLRIDIDASGFTRTGALAGLERHLERVNLTTA